MNRPQTDKLKALNLFMHSCGRLYSAKPGAHCSKCGPDEVVIAEAQPVKPKRTRKAKAAPITSDEVRAKNKDAADKRAARRKGLGDGLHEGIN